MPPTTAAPRASEPRDRLLTKASDIFYARGIHSVGIEEIVATAEVTRSTLYRHFPSKEDLVVAYLQSASQAEQEAMNAAVGTDRSPDEALHAIASVVAGQIGNPRFRGCAFLNAAAEYPAVEHPVHQAVLAHRRWFLDTVALHIERLSDKPSPGAADLFIFLRDGAMSAGCLGDPDEVIQVFHQGVEMLLSAQRA